MPLKSLPSGSSNKRARAALSLEDIQEQKKKTTEVGFDLSRFTNLTDADKTALSGEIKGSSEEGIFRAMNLIARLPSDIKGDVAKKLLKNQLASAGHKFTAGPATESGTVFDSFLKDDGTLLINLPENLEAYADNTFFNALLRLINDSPDVTISYVKDESIVLDDKSYLGLFGYGLFDELINDSQIANISFIPDEGYSSGKAWIKYLIVRKVLNENKIPDRYRVGIPQKIHSELTFEGRKKAWSKSTLLERALQTGKFKDKVHARVLRTLFDNVIAYQMGAFVNKYNARVKIENFLADANAVLGYKKPSRVIGGRSETIEPGRPNEVATLFPFEKKWVTDIFHEEWDKSADLIKRINEVILRDSVTTKWDELENWVQTHIDRKLAARRQVEKLTQDRFSLLGTNVPQGTNRIEAIRATLAPFDTIEKAVNSDIKPELVDPRIIWGSLSVLLADDSIAFLRNLNYKDCKNRYARYGALVTAYLAAFETREATTKLVPRLEGKQTRKGSRPPKR